MSDTTARYDVSMLGDNTLYKLQNVMEDIFLTYEDAPQWVIDVHDAIEAEWGKRER